MIKNQINTNKNYKNKRMDSKVFLWVIMMLRIKIIGPLIQKVEIAQLNFLHFLKNWPTSTTHNLVIFHYMDAILDFLESLRCPL